MITTPKGSAALPPEARPPEPDAPKPKQLYRILKERVRVNRDAEWSGLQPDVGYRVVFLEFPDFRAVLCRRAKWQSVTAPAWYVIEESTGRSVAHGADTRAQICKEAAEMLNKQGAAKIAAAFKWRSSH